MTPIAQVAKRTAQASSAARASATDSASEARRDAHNNVATLIARARVAAASFAEADQPRTDDAVTALAWSLYKPEHARALAEMAVTDTGLGNVRDKITKNQRKTFGTLRDLLRVPSVGVIERLPHLGLVKYAKPVGVVAALTPSTNPAATPVNKAMLAIKGRNAIIIAPSPTGCDTTTETVRLMRAGLDTVGAPPDLVQVLPAPITREATTALMQGCDLVVVTGSQNNVRNAYQSGRPAIGVGAGNVPVILDESAELKEAAHKIRLSKTFDNATSCSSENALVILDAIYDEAIVALREAGGYLANAKEKESIQKSLWRDGKLNRDVIATDAEVFAQRTGLPATAQKCAFFMVEEDGIGPAHPFSDEKLSVVLAVYRAADFDDAMRICAAILQHNGRGHSCGIHTRNIANAERLAERLEVVRVLVNQPHTFGNGGSFDNGLNFTLSMGCGTWAGNSISENLNYRNFLNITHLSVCIAEDKPTEEALFGDYWRRFGK